MAFDLESVLPKDRIETYSTYEFPDGTKAHVRCIRSPNPDPVVREQKLQEIGRILYKGWLRLPPERRQ